MRAFHIDMNTAHFRKDYLEKWLRRFKQYGYDTVLWEVESGVKWQTCPEAALADAFSKKVFREILAYAAELHLTNIPLLQTLGHCEYVLKHAPYKGFRELAEYTDQYCPENKKVSSFLKKWLQEYISVFDQPAVFHIGADEANHLGLCPRCQQYKPYEIYIRHVNRLTSFLTAQGITPAIWGDMILHYPRKLPRLDKRIIIFDWRYERDGSAHFHFWGDRSYYAYKPAAVPSRYKKIFKNYLFKGKKRSADQFYTTSFLTAAGYRTVTCAASSAYGDNVFNPLFPLRVKNAMASLKNDRQKSLDGYLLTSWTVHLFPWELQLPVLAVALYSKQANAFSFSGFKKWFCSYFFHTTDQSFFTALRYLSRVSFYTHTAAIGIDKKGEPVAPDHLLQKVAALKQNQKLQQELGRSRRNLHAYQQAGKILAKYKAVRNKRYLLFWQRAARNLIMRNRSIIFILENYSQWRQTGLLPAQAEKERRQLLKETADVAGETNAMYRKILKPQRWQHYIEWLYGSVRYCLQKMGAD